MRKEIEALRNQLKKHQVEVERDLEAALAAKEAIIEQLRRELHDLQAKLDDADEKILHLTASKAAEIVRQFVLMQLCGFTCIRVCICNGLCVCV